MRTIVQIIVTALSLGGMFGLCALGVALMYRITHAVHVAFGSVIMIVGFSLWSLIRLGWVSALAAPLVGAVIGTLISLVVYLLVLRPMLRRGHLTVIVALLGVDVILYGIALVSWGADARFIPPQMGGEFFLLGAVVGNQQLVLFASVAFLVIALFAFFRFALLGKAMLAAADDREGAVAVGVDQSRMQFLAIVISGALAGVAAAMTVPIIPVDPNLGTALSLTIVIAMVLGGMGSLPGALAGGILLGTLQGITTVYAPSWSEVVQFGALLLAMGIRGIDFRRLRRRLGFIVSRTSTAHQRL